MSTQSYRLIVAFTPKSAFSLHVPISPCMPQPVPVFPYNNDLLLAAVFPEYRDLNQSPHYVYPNDVNSTLDCFPFPHSNMLNIFSGVSLSYG